jgi:hypothetical protein
MAKPQDMLKQPNTVALTGERLYWRNVKRYWEAKVVG